MFQLVKPKNPAAPVGEMMRVPFSGAPSPLKCPTKDVTDETATRTTRLTDFLVARPYAVVDEKTEYVNLHKTTFAVLAGMLQKRPVAMQVAQAAGLTTSEAKAAIEGFEAELESHETVLDVVPAEALVDIFEEFRLPPYNINHHDCTISFKQQFQILQPEISRQKFAGGKAFGEFYIALRDAVGPLATSTEFIANVAHDAVLLFFCACALMTDDLYRTVLDTAHFDYLRSVPTDSSVIIIHPHNAHTRSKNAIDVVAAVMVKHDPRFKDDEEGRTDYMNRIVHAQEGLQKVVSALCPVALQKFGTAVTQGGPAVTEAEAAAEAAGPPAAATAPVPVLSEAAQIKASLYTNGMCHYHDKGGPAGAGCHVACVKARCGVNNWDSSAKRSPGGMVAQLFLGSSRAAALLHVNEKQDAPPATASQWSSLLDKVHIAPSIGVEIDDVDSFASAMGWQDKSPRERVQKYLASKAGSNRQAVWRVKNWEPLTDEQIQKMDLYWRRNPRPSACGVQILCHSVSQ
jgi:hypothetical protein